MPDDFQKKLADEEAAGVKARLEDTSPIGAGTDGELNYVEAGSPKFEPMVIGGEDEEVDDLTARYEELSDLDEADLDKLVEKGK